jgi:mono/diheme cytochrome c family protein
MTRAETPSTLSTALAAVAALGFGLAFAPSDASAQDAAAGKTVYTTNCFSCHGATGKGDGPVGAALNPKPRDFSTGDFKFDANKDGTPGEDADLTLVIKTGAAAYGGSPLMAPWPTLSDADVANVIAYIRSLKQ